MAPRKLKRAASAEELSKVELDQEKGEEKLAPKRRGKISKNIPKSEVPVIDENSEHSELEDVELPTKVGKGRGRNKGPVLKANGTPMAGTKVKKALETEKSNDEDLDTEEGDVDELPIVPKKRGRQGKSYKESDDEVTDVQAPKSKRGRSGKSKMQDEKLETGLEKKAPKGKKGRSAKQAVENDDIEESVEDEVSEDKSEGGRKRNQGKKAVVKPTVDEKAARGKGLRKKVTEEPDDEIEDTPIEPEEGKKGGAKQKMGKTAPAKPKRGKAAAKESEYVDLDGKELRVSIEHCKS